MLLFKHGFGISYGIVIREYAGTRFLNQFLRPIVLLSHLPGPKPEVHLTDRRTHTHTDTHTHTRSRVAAFTSILRPSKHLRQRDNG